MAGQRQSKLVTIAYQPGYFTNSTDRGAKNRYKNGNRVRFHNGLPEKIGGWERQALTGANNGLYVGSARALHDWSSLDTQQWIGLGTQCKLYLVNTNALSDITPLRKTSNVSDPFTTTNGSATVSVQSLDHRANPGDHIRVYSSTAVGGLTLAGEYDIITIIDPDNFTITATSVASGGATGGGSVTIEFDISCGLAENGELLGYGTGTYGSLTYGTPRVAGTGVPAKLRAWSLANWGEDLVASYNDGELYWWDRTLGQNSRAALVLSAPTNIQHMVVDDQLRRIILFGCTDLNGQADRMDVRWCSIEDLNDWVPDAANTAGEKRLDYGSRIVTALRTRAGIVAWTDTHLYSVAAVSEADYGFTALGSCSIAGQNARCDVNGVVFFMGVDDFFVYDGTLRVLACEVWTHVFENIDKTQLDKSYCSSYQSKNEVTWYYQTTGASECDSYVTLNYKDNVWYFGTMNRTAYHDSSEAISSEQAYPYAAHDGYLYIHEMGTDEVEGSTTNAMEWFLETGDGAVSGSDTDVLVGALVPDFDRLEVGMRITIKTKRRPRDEDYIESGPYEFDTYDTDISVRAKGSQIAFRFDPAVDENGATELGQDWRMGDMQVAATQYGGR